MAAAKGLSKSHAQTPYITPQPFYNYNPCLDNPTMRTDETVPPFSLKTSFISVARAHSSS